MTDLLKLILGVLASLFRSRAKLEAENLVLRQQINVLRRQMPKRPDLNNPDRFLFVWLCPGRGYDCQARNDHSLAPCWISGVLAPAIAVASLIVPDRTSA